MKNLKSVIVLKSAVAIFLLMSIAGCTKEDSKTGQNTPGGSNPNEIIIQNMSYDPSPLTIDAGTKITWRNKDSVAHTVTSNDGVFDSGSIGANGTFSYTFPTPGTYPYHCTFHAGMSGSVTVK